MRVLSRYLFVCVVVCCVLPGIASEPDQLRDLNSHFPFTPPAGLEQWQARAPDLELQLQTSLGLYPLPVLDPVEPNIYGEYVGDGFTVEKLTFESLPGLFVTGNLYRPSAVGADEKLPAVLCPHGHWENARFYQAAESEVKRLLSVGAERFENAARNHIQARCIQLARMGCVVFHWDMLGYSDSTQISMARAHRFAQQDKAKEVTSEGWLLFSPLAEAHGQSVMGLQALATWRAVDMLLSLPEVDPERIAITGASGGGTQSFIGAALDQRIGVAFPAVMVSTGMQGGCTCENASGLRVGTGNVEMAGLIAPRPQGLTAADDWTRTMPEDGYPELRRLYALFDAEDKVALFPNVHFRHNFNHVSRTSMYGWINRHFRLGLETPVLERDFKPISKAELSVWDEQHPQPPGGEEFERKLLKLWSGITQSQMLALLRGDLRQQAELHEILLRGWYATLGLTALPWQQIECEPSEQEGRIRLQSEELGEWTLLTRQLESNGGNQSFGTAKSDDLRHDHDLLDMWQPQTSDLNIRVTAEEGQIIYYPYLAGRVITDKPNGQGAPVVLETVKQRLVENPRLAACYTYGYNSPQFALRAQQLGITLRWLSAKYPQSVISVHGQGAEAALAAAGAFCAQASNPAEPLPVTLELEPGQFKFAEIEDIRDPYFLPNSARFMDLPALLACLRSADISVAVGSDTAEPLRAFGRLHDRHSNKLSIRESALEVSESVEE